MIKIEQEEISKGDWKFSIVESLSYGFRKTKKFFWVMLGLYVLTELVQFVLSFASNVLVRLTIQSTLGWLVIFAVTQAFLLYVSIMISLGWFRVFLAVLAGKVPELAYFLDTKNHKYFWSLVGTNILFGLTVIAGLILCVIPGIVWLYTYMYAPLLVVDEKLSPTKALAASRKLVAGQRLNLFVWSLALIGINIVGMLCLGIGLLITVPTTYFASIYVYGKLAGKKIA
ncbi:putative integral membrane protein [Candidatus Termititenax aidoneus]|uniref:Integral membrane protein n=1 Tax=Termititenax aidoneus TaxID=2218524 RepID=A0A388TCB3_TERA1|nr:putative integral membrane protein [Candidatus Termititenax aidoneus]